MPNLLLPTKDRAMAGWRFDITALLEALDILEIEREVEVKFTAGIHRRGAHRDRAGRHVVTISTYLPQEQASETLWHELVHCSQSERTDNFTAAYRLQSSRVGYHRNAFEVEAREVAADFSPVHPLTK